jgi:XTP/dITP diphosphohydrolase
MTKLLFATQNAGKLREIQLMLADLPFDIISPADLKSLSPEWSDLANTDVAETGSTLSENAKIKAQYFASRTGLLTAADDSGLMVAELGDFPGVASNRWMQGTDHERNLGLLSKLDKADDRRAEFMTVLCLIDPTNEQEHFFEGKVEGKIGLEPKGDDGFGYDPIFIPRGYDQTFAQLGIDLKNQLSHRSKALSKLKEFLENYNSESRKL